MALTALKLIFGLTIIAVIGAAQTVILLVLLPSRTARIRSCILFERLVGYSCLWLIGCRLSLSGAAHLDPQRPAIYVVNHTSLTDLFIALRLMPYGAVGIVKKEVIRYPFFGQMYLLTGHLRVDRSRSARAVASMRKLGELVRRARLSVMLSPEGTRARDGRLLPFKKGFVHLARQTGLPVVPIVVSGAHRAWRKNSLAITGGLVHVEVLPPVDTSDWTALDTDAAVEQIHALFRRCLPGEQQPAPAPA